MILTKPGVSLEKRTGRTGISGYGPVDRDLRAQGEGLRRSNLERSLEIGWLRMEGGNGGGAGSLESSPAAALRRRWPYPAFPGSKRTRSGSGGDYATRIVHLRLLRASGRLVVGRATLAAALRGGARRRGAFRVLQGLRPNKTSTKGA